MGDPAGVAFQGAIKAFPMQAVAPDEPWTRQVSPRLALRSHTVGYGPFIESQLSRGESKVDFSRD